MTSAQLKKLEREWAAKLRASGFQDIESPSGMVQSWDARSDGNLQDTAALAEDARRAAQLRFANDFERRVWALHVEGLSNRVIATRLCVYRKLVNQTMAALKARMERPRPGRRRDPASMRSEGLRYELRLTPEVRLVVERLRHALPRETSVAAMVRLGLMRLALEIPMEPPTCGAVSVRTAIRKSAGATSP